MTRRQALSLFAVFAAAFTIRRGSAIAQMQIIGLRLVRRTGWEELMGRNKCVIGDLYRSDPSFPLSNLGTKISKALELAYRNNLNEISSIPPGDYRGGVRIDGPRGWRIELSGTGPRSHIQLHVGNRPSDTVGCILPGTGDSNDERCSISGSAAAMSALRAALGPSADRGPSSILLRIQNR
jgi:hypothetical protein